MTAYLKTETLFVILPDTVFLFHLTSWCLRHSAGVKLILQKQTNKIHTYKFLYLYCNSSVDCTISSIISSLHTQYISQELCQTIPQALQIYVTFLMAVSGQVCC